MKYKIMTIAVASLLPLGFAASASASDLTTEHAVTFTVADARSISVAVTGSVNNTLDFGTISTAEEKTLADAVTVTFSTPGNDEGIEVMLVDSGGLAVSLPTGVTMSAAAKAISGTTKAEVRTPAVGSFGQLLYGFFDEPHLNKSFDVDFTLTTTAAATGTGNYFIQYRMFED
jgi:hypothetical protein